MAAVRSMIAAKVRAALNGLVAGRLPWPLLLFGPAGGGKTCSALCLLDGVGGGCKIVTVAEACEELISAGKGELFRGEARITIGGWWADWRERRCVVVDELGIRQNVSDFQLETVKRLHDEREAVGGPAVFISNLAPSELASVYDDRVASRLSAGTVVNVAGDDRRLAGGEAGAETGDGCEERPIPIASPRLMADAEKRRHVALEEAERQDLLGSMDDDEWADRVAAALAGLPLDTRRRLEGLPPNDQRRNRVLCGLIAQRIRTKATGVP